MFTDRQMLVRLDPTVKALVDAAAAQEGISGNMFAQKAFIYYLQHLFPDLKIAGRTLIWCVHCASRPLHQDNRTQFCTNCQDSVTLPMLQKLHPESRIHPPASEKI